MEQVRPPPSRRSGTRHATCLSAVRARSPPGRADSAFYRPIKACQSPWWVGMLCFGPVSAFPKRRNAAALSTGLQVRCDAVPALDASGPCCCAAVRPAKRAVIRANKSKTPLVSREMHLAEAAAPAGSQKPPGRDVRGSRIEDFTSLKFQKEFRPFFSPFPYPSTRASRPSRSTVLLALGRELGRIWRSGFVGRHVLPGWLWTVCICVGSLGVCMLR